MRTLKLQSTAIVFAAIFSCPAHANIENVVFILSDDHRYDFMSFMDKSPDFLETPNLDRMARAGVHLKNAFVTTSLCSPSRASILTGRVYACSPRGRQSTSRSSRYRPSFHNTYRLRELRLHLLASGIWDTTTTNLDLALITGPALKGKVPTLIRNSILMANGTRSVATTQMC